MLPFAHNGMPLPKVAGLSAVTALLHVEGALLIGTADGELLLLDAASGSLLARARAHERSPVTHLACDSATTFVFVLQSGAVSHAACPLADASLLSGGGADDVATIDLQPPHPECSAVSCMAPSWSRRLGTRLCCACLGEYALHVFGFRQNHGDDVDGDEAATSGDRRSSTTCELQAIVPLQLPLGFEIASGLASLAWAADDSVLLCDGVHFMLVPPLPMPGGPTRRESVPVAAMPVRTLQQWLEPPHARDGRPGGHARTFSLGTGETIVLGPRKGGGTVALTFEAADWSVLQREAPGTPTGALGTLSRPALALDGSGPPLDAVVGWPLLITCSRGHVRIYDLVEGLLVHAIRLPASATAGGGSGGSGGSSSSVPIRLSARGPHAVALSVGRALFPVPAASGGWLAREVQWLRQLAARPWDAALVERHLERVLEGRIEGVRHASAEGGDADGEASAVHPLARAIGRLGGEFERWARLTARAEPTADDCVASCVQARLAVKRLVAEVLLCYPQLAPRAAAEIAYGAAGVELVSAVEMAAYEALRRPLVSVHMEAYAAEMTLYQQQLRLLSKLNPEHLGLPKAFCGEPSPPPPPQQLLQSSLSSSVTPQQPSSSSSQTLPALASAPLAPARQPYAKPVGRLQQLPQATTPTRALACLVDTCRLIAQAAEALGAPPPAADELVPLVAYVIVIAQVASLPIEMALLQGLATDHQQAGEQGYCLATFEVAMRWVLTLKWDQLTFAAGCRRLPASRAQPSSHSAQQSAAPAAVVSPPTINPSIRQSMELLRALEAELLETRAEALRSALLPTPPTALWDKRTGRPIKRGSSTAPLAAHALDGAAAAPAASHVIPATAPLAEASEDTAPSVNAAAADAARAVAAAGGERQQDVQAPGMALESLGVRELLAEAKRRSIDCSGCVERDEIIALLRSEIGSPRSGGWRVGHSPHSPPPAPVAPQVASPRPSNPLDSLPPTSPPPRPSPPSAALPTTASLSSVPATVAAPQLDQAEERLPHSSSASAAPAPLSRGAAAAQVLLAQALSDRQAAAAAVARGDVPAMAHSSAAAVPPPKRLPRMGAKSRG